MLLHELVETSRAVAETRARTAKVESLATLLRALRPEEVPIAVGYLSGTLERLGVGFASLRELPQPTDEPRLELLEVSASLERLGGLSGPGSQAARKAELADLLGSATETEQRFLQRLLYGELRQGANEGVMVEAVARAADIPAAEVRRATMLAGRIDEVARVALAEGRQRLAGIGLELFRPVKPMLAGTAADVSEALGRTGVAALEWKLDGARLQVHRREDEVRAYTRSLAEVTGRVPEIVSAVRALPVEQVVLDGEVIALRPDGRPHPFQVSMSRFGSSGERSAVILTPFFFDCLHADGEDLLDRPASERAAVLERVVPAELRTERLVTGDPAEATAFLERALAQGHEGVMVKALDGTYEAGRRGGGWLKVKPARTLDLAVLAAEWGHGRRQGWLSNLHLGARDAEGGFVMLGKTFKGMTDAMLAWQTEHLLGLATEQDGHIVYVRPELVVEIAFEGVQASSRYPGGVALRFARVKGYRPDKRAEDADTIATIRAIRDSGPDGPSADGG